MAAKLSISGRSLVAVANREAPDPLARSQAWSDLPANCDATTPATAAAGWPPPPADPLPAGRRDPDRAPVAEPRTAQARSQTGEGLPPSCSGLFVDSGLRSHMGLDSCSRLVGHFGLIGYFGLICYFGLIGNCGLVSSCCLVGWEVRLGWSLRAALKNAPGLADAAICTCRERSLTRWYRAKPAFSRCP
jgi:hypothetical protein